MMSVNNHRWRVSKTTTVGIIINMYWHWYMKFSCGPKGKTMRNRSSYLDISTNIQSSTVVRVDE